MIKPKLLSFDSTTSSSTRLKMQLAQREREIRMLYFDAESTEIYRYSKENFRSVELFPILDVYAYLFYYKWNLDFVEQLLVNLLLVVNLICNRWNHMLSCVGLTYCLTYQHANDSFQLPYRSQFFCILKPCNRSQSNL